MTKDDVYLIAESLGSLQKTVLNPLYVEKVEIYSYVPEGHYGSPYFQVRAWYRGHWIGLSKGTQEYMEAHAIWKRAAYIITSPNAAVWLEEETEDAT